jgi:hypothetical protein
VAGRSEVWDHSGYAMLKRSLILVAVVAAPVGACNDIGSGSGSAQGPLWILGCRDRDPLGTPDTPQDFNLEPTFFAGEPIEDIAGVPPSNRLIISMRRNGNSVEINDTLYFDIRDSAQIARCIRGRTVNGVPDWDTSSGYLSPDGTVATVPPAPPWCMQPATIDGLPQIHLVPFGPVAVSFQPLASCHSTMHPPAIVTITGVASDGYITFTDFGTAVDPDQANTPPDAREGIKDDFKVAYDDRLQATFQFNVEDARVAAAIRDKVVPPPQPVIGGMLSGNFDFDLKRGRVAQTFP